MTSAWAGGGLSTGEAQRFQKDLRRGLEASAREAYLTQIRALDERLRESREAAKALLEEQKVACAADYNAIKAKADEAFKIASDLARQERDAERDAKKRACAVEASSVRERIRRKAELEAAKRQAKRELATSLRTIHSKGRTDHPQIAAEEKQARAHYAETLDRLDKDIAHLGPASREALAEQRTNCTQEYEQIKAKAADACAEAQRLGRAEREAKKAAKKKQCALEAKWIRDTHREEAQALRDKKNAERALKAETRQIEASTRPPKPKAPKQAKAPRQDLASRIEANTRQHKPKAPKQDLGSRIASAFDALDAKSGNHNQVLIYDLRRAVKGSREQFDTAMGTLRRDGVLTLSAEEGRFGHLSAAAREAGIPGPSGKLVYAARRSPPYTEPPRRRYGLVKLVPS